jgi:uncharacterized protein (UPF0332 family)
VNLSAEVKALMTKARHALEVAGRLLDSEDFGEAAGRAYYAIFYAAQALLIAHGIKVVKHSSVASVLGREFARTGKIDPKFHGIILNARQVRETADYEVFDEVSESTARSTVADARSFILEIERLLNE